MLPGRASLKGILYVEAASQVFALGLPLLFALFTLLGNLGARAQGIPPPPLEAQRLGLMALTLVVVLGVASLPVGALLGWGAGRLRRRRLGALLALSAVLLVCEALAAAFPLAALSPYFLSNTPPAQPFPWGAVSAPREVVFGIAYLGAAFFVLFFAPILVFTVVRLERVTRP